MRILLIAMIYPYLCLNHIHPPGKVCHIRLPGNYNCINYDHKLQEHIKKRKVNPRLDNFNLS